MSRATPKAAPDVLASCVAAYQRAATLASLRGLTLDERERFAYLANDQEALGLIYASEEEAADVITPEHEAMIDDRNRLRDALTDCMERMHDAIEQLDTYNKDDEPELDLATGEREPLDFAPEFHDAAEAAGEALAQCESEYDETTAGKLAKVTHERDELRTHLAAQDGKLRAADAVLRDAQALTLEYRRTSKPAPKWAQRLIATLTRSMT